MAAVDGLLGLIIWAFCAFGAAWVAETKGYSAFAWLLLGMIGGPFAVLVVGLAERKGRNVADREAALRARRSKDLAASLANPVPPNPEDDGDKVYEIP